MPDDLPEIYGICRGHDCKFIWTVEPTVAGHGDEPVCPDCGREGWPMSPVEAEAKHTVPRGRFGDLSCPYCQHGKLRMCRSCWNEQGDNAKIDPTAYVCSNADCGQHMTPMQAEDIKVEAVRRERDA